MPITLTGETEEIVRAALGGSKATPKRVKALLARLSEPSQVAPMVGEPFVDLLGPDGESLDEVVEKLSHPDPTPSSGQDPRIDILLSTVQTLAAKVNELQRPPEDATKAAIADGLVPVVGIGAPKLGVTGPADLPVGVWFDSPPFAPAIKMKMCACSNCKPHRIYHYYCVICKTGPLAIQSNRRPFTKQWMAPGGFWGIAHYCCPNLDCHTAYNRLVTNRAIMADVQVQEDIIAAEAPATPTRPIVPEGSD